ncbi:MAG: GNAT family N-acetyltransferase [Anaerolineae bacterium]|nr:GNAT family N-acetyltransferase [Anaerolineae bacterium]
MNVRGDLDAAAFLDRVRDTLEEDEAANNLLLGLLTRLAREQTEREPAGQTPARSPGDRPPFLALVEHDGQVPLVMLMTPPARLIVHGRGDGLDAALDEAVSYLLDQGVSPPGVIGPREVATAFAQAWQQRRACRVAVQMEQMIYRLDRVNAIASSPGRLTQATTAHIPLLTGWMVGFSAITLDPLPPHEARARVERTVAASSLYLWHDGAPVSMAWKARPTRHGVVVSGVYTPPEHRKRGYATSCVAVLSRVLLDEGYQFCALYADLANPTSNSMYQRIGYRPVQPSIVCDFQLPVGGET